MIVPRQKIIHPDQLAVACDRYRNDRKKIVFTNGCFDLLHIGHLRYLYDARQQGDVLIVGVNGDESVRRLKGAGRPIIGEKRRMEMLCGFYVVDHAVQFDEDTPETLIRLIRPDVLTKGGDWKPEQIVGSGFVRSYGGRVLSLRFFEGNGTTSIIDTIIDCHATSST